jgi:hypothetical protein
MIKNNRQVSSTSNGSTGLEPISPALIPADKILKNAKADEHAPKERNK